MRKSVQRGKRGLGGKPAEGEKGQRRKDERVGRGYPLLKHDQYLNERNKCYNQFVLSTSLSKHPVFVCSFVFSFFIF